MTYPWTMAECLPPKFVINPKTTNGGTVTSDAISMKTALKAWFIVGLTQAVGHATVVSLLQATDVAIGTNKAGPTSSIWASEDTATNDTLVEQTAAASFTVSADVKFKQVIIEVDPAALDDTYDVVYVTTGDSSQATNFVAAWCLIQPRYSGRVATQPSVILD
jgi:hypothetical protein